MHTHPPTAGVMGHPKATGNASRFGCWCATLAILLACVVSGGCTPGSKSAAGWQEGKASYYAHKYHGRTTANGERFDMHALTAAHRTLPFGTVVRVTNAANGRQVTVRINDRGPFVEGRIIDLSLAAAERLEMVKSGVVNVQLEVLARVSSASH